MARPAGLEPATYCLEGSRSIQAELWAHLGSQLTVHEGSGVKRNFPPALICQLSTVNCQLSFVGVNGGARTLSLWSHSPVLCQLSYAHHGVSGDLKRESSILFWRA